MNLEIEKMESLPALTPTPRPLMITKSKNSVLLWVNCLILGIPISAGPLVMRLYYIHGGKCVWLQSFLQTAGFPVMIFPMAFSYHQRRGRGRGLGGRPSTTDEDSGSGTRSPPRQRLLFITPRLLAAAAAIGIVAGLADYLYGRGVSLIPVSTSALILSSQLAFTAVFSFLLVKQRFTPFSVNSVMLLTVAAVVLAMHTSSDRPEGTSDGEYLMGFFMTLAASALFGLMLPLIELAYKKADVVSVNYPLVMEMQFVLSFSATIFCLIGMLVSKDFQAIPKEAREFELGKTAYYIILVTNAIIWVFGYLGILGVIYFESSLLSGIIIAISLPISEILAIIFYKEKFNAQKGVSLSLSLWGFCSYFYGEYYFKNKNVD